MKVRCFHTFVLQHPIYGVNFTLALKEECPGDLVLPSEIEAAKEKELYLKVDHVSVHFISFGDS